MWRQQMLSQARVPCRVGVAAAPVIFSRVAMCLDPRPDHLLRASRRRSRVSTRASALHAPALGRFAQVAVPAPVVRAPALWALDTLAGDDELVARGWVILDREQ
jgi:hypothetical protein